MTEPEPVEEQQPSKRTRAVQVRGDEYGTYKTIEVSEDVAGQWDEAVWRDSPPRW
ncbi:MULTISPECIES: hypothetical protein [Mycolicibacterium]|uniref:hypothetical protein n=1 Tax=Mycolicibacterium TaxID=1866885 RepID=UPI000A7FF1CD|nr:MULTISPECIES: hypothetical protein [Mycolicibacterium]MCW1821429.1 hypothetical protein [Mycolicibacterium senegalense]